MYYEAGTVLKTHPNVPYNDGIRRIFLYADGELPEGNSEDDQRIKALLRYINDSTDANATDDNTKKLNGIVKSTKSKKDIGIAYMKSWEREKELKREGKEEGRIEGEEMLAQLLKQLAPGSDEFNKALNASAQERQALYKKYNITDRV